MRKIITRAQAIRYAIYFIAALLIISIFPLRLFHEDITTAGKEHAAGAVTVGGEMSVLQQFTAEYDHIASIGVYIQGDYYDDQLTMRVFRQANAQLLREVTVSTGDLKRVDCKTYAPGSGGGYADVYINLDTEVGEGYFYTLEGITTDFEVLFEMTGNSGAANNGLMQYGSENREAYNVMTRYTYTQPLRKLHSLIWIAVLAAFAALMTFVLNKLEEKCAPLNTLCTIQWILRIICNPLIVAAAAAAILYIGPLHVFSIYISDIVVMILGVLILAGLLLYAVNREYGTDAEAVVPGSPAGRMQSTSPTAAADRVRDVLQSLCIALAMWACVEYMNSLYEIFHDIAWRKMAFFLGLGVIVTFTFAELINWYDAVMLVGGIVAARLYYVHNLPDMVDEYHVEAMMWTCRLMPVLLILAAHVIRCLVIAIRDRSNPLKIVSWPYAVVSAALATGMIIRRHHEYWPILMTVIAGVYAFRFLFWENRDRMLTNILNGILFHFAGCVIFCLMHRPYTSVVYVRYPLVFHTVTVTAEYMALVMCAALVKLFAKYNRVRTWSKCVGEMCILGVVTVYMLFTMSRTAMIGVVAMGLVMWVAYSFKAGRLGRAGSMLAMAGLVLVSTLVLLPPVFTAQRVLPAIIGEPRIMEIEVYPQDVLVSADLGSEDYITFSRLTKGFCNKMFGIDEDKIRLDRYTIYGKRTDVYIDWTELYDLSSEEKPGPAAMPGDESVGIAAPGIMLTGEQAAALLKKGDDFVPPREWSLDEETPEEWWDEDYWFYDTETQDWVFEIWRVEEEHNRDISNGRMEIFRSYFEQLTPEGHEEMGAILPNGEIAMHAHNNYLQVAFDGGIIIGIMFTIWCVCTCVQALMVFLRLRRRDPSAGIVLAVSVAYAVCGLTEWMSHPCNPFGLIMLMLVAPMALFKYGQKTDETV